MDDVLTVWEENVSIPYLLRELNSLTPSIQFTHEVEREGRISYLDLEITKGIYPSFRVFRKKTCVNSFLHFYSNHPNSIKKSVVFGQFLRALRICDAIYIDAEINFIFEVFQNLCYPKQFILECLRQAWKKQFYVPQIPQHLIMRCMRNVKF